MTERPFGHILRELREKRGFTVNQLGIKSDVSPGLISKLENGKRGIPKPDTIEKIAKGLKIDYKELMRIAGYIEEEEKSSENQKESEHTLPESKMDLIIRETEEKYGVTLHDDPVVESIVREVLRGIAISKKGG